MNWEELNKTGKAKRMIAKDSKPQIKSRHRVTNHGEVFTHEREVNGMLDLVKNETEITELSGAGKR